MSTQRGECIHSNRAGQNKRPPLEIVYQLIKSILRCPKSRLPSVKGEKYAINYFYYRTYPFRFITRHGIAELYISVHTLRRYLCVFLFVLMVHMYVLHICSRDIVNGERRSLRYGGAVSIVNLSKRQKGFNWSSMRYWKSAFFVCRVGDVYTTLTSP